MGKRFKGIIQRTAAFRRGLANGFASAGDYMSTASFLGSAGLAALKGFDGLAVVAFYLIAQMVGAGNMIQLEQAHPPLSFRPNPLPEGDGRV